MSSDAESGLSRRALRTGRHEHAAVHSTPYFSGGVTAEGTHPPDLVHVKLASKTLSSIQCTGAHQ
ncbi:MAG: hypothetical protein M3443_03185 [Actinomycetota bacterium]|nr:hypothetical protein [Actinomycetota bacterium]